MGTLFEPGYEVKIVRVCGCGCGKSLEGRRGTAKFYDVVCRNRAHRNGNVVPLPTASPASAAPAADEPLMSLEDAARWLQSSIRSDQTSPGVRAQLVREYRATYLAVQAAGAKSERAGDPLDELLARRLRAGA